MLDNSTMDDNLERLDANSGSLSLNNDTLNHQDKNADIETKNTQMNIMHHEYTMRQNKRKVKKASSNNKSLIISDDNLIKWLDNHCSNNSRVSGFSALSRQLLYLGIQLYEKGFRISESGELMRQVNIDEEIESAVLDKKTHPRNNQSINNSKDNATHNTKNNKKDDIENSNSSFTNFTKF